MPVLYQVSGTAEATLPAGFAAVTGTATSDYQAATQVTGTTVTTASAVTPWLASAASPVRGSRVRVLLGAGLEDVTGLVGTVEVVRDAAQFTPSASFTLVDTRCAYFADPTFSLGGQPVVILGYAEIDGVGSEFTRFQGYTESIQSEDPYVPRATFRCVGISSWLTERNANAGCLRVLPFSGETRLGLIADFITAAGATPPAMPAGSGVLLTKAVDLSGLSVVDLSRAWSELEGYYVRDLAGVLDFVPEDAVVSGPALYEFAPSNYVATKELPPDHPTTIWTLSSTRIRDEVIAAPSVTVEESEVGGIDSAGDHWKTITQVYKTGDVETRRVISEWKDYARLGAATETKTFRLVKETTVVYSWRTYDLNAAGYFTSLVVPPSPTAQPLSVVTTIKAWYSPLKETATGTLWTDGTYHAHSVEQWLTVGVTTVTYTYTTCQLTGTVETTTGYYSRQTSGGYEYPDGTMRAGQFYTLQTIGTVASTFSDNANAAPPYVSKSSKVTEAWRVTSYWDDAGTKRPIETFGMVAQESTTRTSLGGDRYSVDKQTVDGAVSTYSRTVEDGATPGPENASPTTPQYTEEAIIVTRSAGIGVFPTVERTETILAAETEAELERVAYRRLRDEQAPREVINAPVLPLLEIYDRVALTDPCRQIVSEVGYLERVTEHWSVINGEAMAEYVLAIPDGAIQ